MAQPTSHSAQPAGDGKAPALVLHLFPTHFTLDERDATYQYNGPLKEFLEAVNRQELPANAVDLFKESDFHDGCIHVHVRDHRVNFHNSGRGAPATPNTTSATTTTANPTTLTSGPDPCIRHLVLRPSPATLWADICSLRNSGTGETLTQDAALEVEAKTLLATRATLNLDPSPHIGRLANINHFNDTKYRIARKRPRNWAAKEEDDEKKRESDKLMLIMDERRIKEFHPKFAKFAFVEDWKKKKALADAEPLVTLDDKIKAKGSARTKPDANCNLNVDSANLIRSLLYQQKFKSLDIIMYTTVNVYQMADGQCYCTLRWGNAPGTGAGEGRLTGSTLRFPLGNYAAALYYIKSLKSHLEVSNKPVMDQARTGGSAQATTPHSGQAAMHGNRQATPLGSASASSPAPATRTPSSSSAAAAPAGKAGGSKTGKPRGKKAKT
ncbi:Spt20 family-domain-containing protein [Powellomyces hirtus]|nr:Spt20 family-domain-containing protein [Powellomyces hirtus]